jgi:type VI secretion system secreted protein VgrG
VVGANGEEIDVDEHGRVVVKFHWDRADGNDEKSSCRVRVSQAWAGKGFGSVFHPRMGQEVIVEFLEGDPDRPIVTGRVYNGEQTIPFDLPSEKTQSGIKSKSSKSGANDNYNEIRFEDKKDSELISIQAEKDLGSVVKNDENAQVGHDRSRQVGNDEDVSIGANRNVQVAADHEESVGANETLSVGESRTWTVGTDESGSVGGNQDVSIGKNSSLTVSGALSEDVGEGLTLKVGKDSDVTIGGSHEESVANDYVLQAKAIQLVAKDEVSIKVGRAELVMKKNGDITLKGKKINVKGSGDVIVKGSKVAMN